MLSSEKHSPNGCEGLGSGEDSDQPVRIYRFIKVFAWPIGTFSHNTAQKSVIRNDSFVIVIKYIIITLIVWEISLE